MKICVTAMGKDLDAEVDPRFGRCQYFIFVDTDTMAFDAVENTAIAAPGGAGIQAAQTVVNKGADVLISGNIGPNAFQVLSTAGVKVATGAYGTVREAIEMYKSGKLNLSGGSTVGAHAGMGMGMGTGGGRGMGRGMGMGQGIGQSMVMPQGEKAEKESLEGLEEMVNKLENELKEVKKRIEELKRR